MSAEPSKETAAPTPLQQFAAAAAAVREKVIEISESPHMAQPWGEWRRGLKELQDFVLQPFPDSTHGRDEPGTVASPTQALVTAQLTGESADAKAEDRIAPAPQPAPEPAPRVPDIDLEPELE